MAKPIQTRKVTGLAISLPLLSLTYFHRKTQAQLIRKNTGTELPRNFRRITTKIGKTQAQLRKSNRKNFSHNQTVNHPELFAPKNQIHHFVEPKIKPHKSQI